MQKGNAGTGETYTAVEKNIPDDFPYMEPDDVAKARKWVVEKIKAILTYFQFELCINCKTALSNIELLIK